MKTLQRMAVILCCLCLSLTLVAQSSRINRNEELRQQTTACIDRIYDYLVGCTPYTLTDQEGNPWPTGRDVEATTRLAKGDFGITTYEWGVTYSAMLQLAQVMDDSRYLDYVYKRFSALGQIFPAVTRFCQSSSERPPLTYISEPRFLDDCGAMCAAMSKATMLDAERSVGFRSLHDHWFDFVMNKEYRMPDGILARHRPANNSVWLDDMYMGIPPIAFRGKLAQQEGDKKLAQKCYQEAVQQIRLFKKYLWLPEKKLYRHGWIEGMSEHPDYHWARANGWAVLTLCDVLDAIPAETPGWQEVLEQFRSLVQGITPYQSPNGLWHQLINHYETYLETSASAIYVYCIAHGVNQGWLDARAYTDVAKSGWRGVMTQVNARGQVENTCVGTGLGWTNTFYANRPVSVYAAHGYGPVLLAAAEMMRMLERQK